MQKIDLVIIGAGPAGMATALHLVQRDPSWAERMVLLEKEAHPRSKLCGGGITPFGLGQLHRLGLEPAVPHQLVRKVLVSYLDLEVEFTAEPAVAVVHRPEFDAWLADTVRAKGIRLQENCAATGIERDELGIMVHSTRGDFSAKAVVLADGSTGKARRWLGLQQRTPSARVLEVFSEVQSVHRGDRSPHIVFRFDPAKKDVQGYFWHFPAIREGRTVSNLGVYDARLYRKDRANLPAVLDEELGREGVEEAEAVQGFPIRLFSRRSPLRAERVLLVGDAAGADPLFGEGISLALGYGEMAAQELQDAFARGRFGFRRYRRRILFSAMGRYLLLRRLVAAVGYRLISSERTVRSLWWIVRWLAGREKRTYIQN